MGAAWRLSQRATQEEGQEGEEVVAKGKPRRAGRGAGVLLGKTQEEYASPLRQSKTFQKNFPAQNRHSTVAGGGDADERRARNRALGVRFRLEI